MYVSGGWFGRKESDTRIMLRKLRRRDGRGIQDIYKTDESGHGHMLTRQMLTRQMLTGQMLTGQMLTPLAIFATIAHKLFV